MLQWLKYSTVPNGVTLYTEKSQTFKNDLNHFDHSLLALMANNLVVLVNVLLPICCHIGFLLSYWLGYALAAHNC